MMRRFDPGTVAMSEGVPLRLMQVRQHLGLNAAEMADRVGLKDRKSWERYERDESAPKADVLSRLSSLGFDVNWILTEVGTMLRQDEALSGGAPSALLENTVEDSKAENSISPLDGKLFDHIADGIERAYREEGAKIRPLQLAKLVGRVYDDLASACSTREEIEGGLKLRLQQLRRDLQSPAGASSSGKRSA